MNPFRSAKCLFLLLLPLALCVTGAPGVAEDQEETDEQEPSFHRKEAVTNHTTTIGGEKVSYRARADYMKVTLRRYHSGHMMYIRSSSLERMSADLRSFLREATE